jgi:hypothetical protein
MTMSSLCGSLRCLQIKEKMTASEKALTEGEEKRRLAKALQAMDDFNLSAATANLSVSEADADGGDDEESAP